MPSLYAMDKSIEDTELSRMSELLEIDWAYGDIPEAVDYSGIIKIIDPVTYQEKSSYSNGGNPAWGGKFNHDRSLLALCSADKVILILNTSTGEIAHILKGHTAHVRAVGWSKGGNDLASCSEDLMIKIWDIETAKEKIQFKHDLSYVKNIAWSNDNKMLALQSYQKMYSVWSIQD